MDYLPCTRKGAVLASTGEIVAIPLPAERINLFNHYPKVGLYYLSATFGSCFQPHLPKIIAPILIGLSDTEEYVREAAMRAGRMVVTNYSNKAIDLLLPELETGMFDPGWRIRVCLFRY